MTRRSAPSLFALCAAAAVWGCAGPTLPAEDLHTDGAVRPAGGGGAQGDAGLDAGTDGGSDAGTDGGFDGGCVHGSYNGTLIDGCDGTGTRTVLVQELDCNVQLYVDRILTCSGTLGGPTDAFDGGCGARTCTSPSLPGTLTCTDSSGSCSLTVCGADGGCGP